MDFKKVVASGAAHESNQGLHGSLQTDGEENGGRVWLNARAQTLFVCQFRKGRGFPGSSDSKASAYNAGDPLQYSCLENPMN